MSAALAARLAKLEAKHRRKTNEVRGVIGNTPEPYVVEIDDVLHLRFPESPTGETFATFALRQQRTLQAELVKLCLL